jgi:hypothetical protein
MLATRAWPHQYPFSALAGPTPGRSLPTRGSQPPRRGASSGAAGARPRRDLVQVSTREGEPAPSSPDEVCATVGRGDGTTPQTGSLGRHAHGRGRALG